MSELFDFTRRLDRLEQVYRRLPRLVGTMAVAFSKERFRAQNWVDTHTTPWPKRREGRKRRIRAILVKTGALKRSVRVTRTGADYVAIGSDIPYAQAHNEGFRGRVQQQVRSHKRRLTKFGVVRGRTLKKRSNIEYGRVQTGTTIVSEHQRVINQNLPQRQFLGESAVLERQLQRQITAEIMRALK